VIRELAVGVDDMWFDTSSFEKKVAQATGRAVSDYIFQKEPCLVKGQY